MPRILTPYVFLSFALYFKPTSSAHLGKQCYWCLVTREHALLLRKRFEQRTGEEIALELLDRRQEEIYWECVPDKVFPLAVQHSRAHKARQGDVDALRTDDQDRRIERD